MMDVQIDSSTDELNFFSPAWLTRWRFPQWRTSLQTLIFFYGEAPKLKEGEFLIGRRQIKWTYIVKEISPEGYPKIIEMLSPWDEYLTLEVLKIKS